MIAQLKGQLERMNQLLAAEKQLVAADRQELNRLQSALQKMREAEVAAAAAAAAAPAVALSAPSAAPAPACEVPVVDAVPIETLESASGETIAIPATGLPNMEQFSGAGLLTGAGAGAGGMGLYVLVQQNRTNQLKEELQGQIGGEQKRVQDLESEAAKMREELAAQQSMVAQLQQQLTMVEQRSRLALASERRERMALQLAAEQAQAALEAEKKKMLSAKFEAMELREKANAAKKMAEDELAGKIQGAIGREQNINRLLVAREQREGQLLERTNDSVNRAADAEGRRLASARADASAARDRAGSDLRVSRLCGLWGGW